MQYDLYLYNHDSIQTIWLFDLKFLFASWFYFDQLFPSNQT